MAIMPTVRLTWFIVLPKTIETLATRGIYYKSKERAKGILRCRRSCAWHARSELRSCCHCRSNTMP
ncbi:hypothetical protein IG631_08614 [Alternaria alternata]|nr:hypothetical protein IG631_08614 [Alternaria alternata]